MAKASFILFVRTCLQFPDKNPMILLDLLEEFIEMNEKEGKTVCCLCGEVLPEGDFGNNAQPVHDGRCCNYCNDNCVIPVRTLSAATKREPEDIIKECLVEGFEEIQKLFTFPSPN